jgi:hypothetical protein
MLRYYCHHHHATVMLHTETFLLYSSNFSDLVANYQPDHNIHTVVFMYPRFLICVHVGKTTAQEECEHNHCHRYQ